MTGFLLWLDRRPLLAGFLEPMLWLVLGLVSVVLLLASLVIAVLRAWPRTGGWR